MAASNPSGHIIVEAISSPVTDLKVWLPDPANPTVQSLENSGNFWHPWFLANIASVEFGSLRFMDWGATNQSPQQDWIDRRKPDMVFQDGVLNRRSPAPSYTSTGDRPTGMAYEHMIALANATGKDPWICVPHLATDDYLTKLAQLIRYGSDGINPYTSPQANPVWPPLDPSLKVWLEYSNEIWSNGGSFPQGNWAEAQAIAAGYGGGNGGKAMFNARRFSQVWSLFQQVFGGSQRIVRVGAIFTASSSYTAPFLTELKNFGPTLSPPVEPDVISPTTYFGNGIQDWAYEQANLNRAQSANKTWFHTAGDFVINTTTGATRPVSKPLTDPYWTSPKLAADLDATFEEWKKRIFSRSTAAGGGPDSTGVNGGFDAALAQTIFRLPETPAYAGLTTPVEFRLYLHGSQYGHKGQFHGLKLTRDVADSASTTYQNWATGIAWNGADSSPTGDANGDGIPNLLAYGLVLDPRARVPASSMPTAVWQAGFLDFLYRKNPHAGDLIYTVRHSINLNDWSDLVIDGTLITETNTATQGDAQIIRVRIPIASDETQRFLQLRVGLSPNS